MASLDRIRRTAASILESMGGGERADIRGSIQRSNLLGPGSRQIIEPAQGNHSGTTANVRLDDTALLVIPCSGAKCQGEQASAASSILWMLDPSRAAALEAARLAMRQAAGVDERSLMPAYLRYSGQLYQHAGSSIHAALTRGISIAIVSGGYGLLQAADPIGTYERRFSLRDWPRGLLEACLLDYAVRVGALNVIAVMSGATDYGKFIRRVDWLGSRITATLITPVSNGGGAMVKVPRAQGEALAALVAHSLDLGWRSSDGLTLDFQRVGA